MKGNGSHILHFWLSLLMDHTHSMRVRCPKMDLGKDQQHHPTVHSGGVRRRRVRGCGCWRYGDLTGDTLHLTHEIFFLIGATIHTRP